jgi:predicted NUDIX family NTP pyrophosphohydrolase
MMPQVQDQEIDVIIYRVREQGLEVFLVNPTTEPSQEAAHQVMATDVQWQAPVAASTERLLEASGAIDLDPIKAADGAERKAIAIEADWHEIPSLRALMYEDYRVAKQKAKQHIRNIIPELDKGAYVAIKDAAKRIMPEQYAFLKELKDIIAEKNSTKYI